MSAANADILLDLLHIASDSGILYRHVADVVDLPELQQAFTLRALAKDDLVGMLSKELAGQGGERAAGGGFDGAVRRTFTDVLVGLSRKPAAGYTYAAELESIEQRLLLRFDHALVVVDSDSLRASLLAEMPRLRSAHAQIVELKDSLA